MSQAVTDALTAQFGEAITKTTHLFGDDTAYVARERLQDVGRFLKEEPSLAFNMPIDCTAVDYSEFGPDHDGPRFAVCYTIYSTTKKHRVRLKIELEEGDPTLPSLTPVWRGFDWPEREAYDMFGVVFEDHYDLRRILLYPEFQGFPLRKDYPLRGYQPLIPIARLDPTNEDPKLMFDDLNPPIPESVLRELRTPKEPENG